MSNDTQRILEMLSEGKVTVDEAERLLEALGGHGPTPTTEPITDSETREDDEQEAWEEGDQREPIGPSSGIRMGAGAFVSEGVNVPPGSVIGMGANISEGVIIESAIEIGMGAFIGEAAHLMKDCKIGKGANIGEGAKIGADATIDTGAFVGEGAKIGARATLGMGAFIGEEAEVRPGSHVPAGGNVAARAVW